MSSLRSTQSHHPTPHQLGDVIYLDHHATTPVDPEVLKAMLPYFTEKFGNPMSQTHAFGWVAERAVEKARSSAAALIKARHAQEIYFTSGATESLNLALVGWAETQASRHLKGEIWTSPVEHKCALKAAEKAASLYNHQLRFLKINRYGQLDLHAFEEQLKNFFTASKTKTEAKAETNRPTPLLISLIHGNNEIGSMNDLEKVATLIDRYDPHQGSDSRVLLHIDAAQTAGYHRIDVQKMRIDMLSLSGHKFYAPKGIGALFIRAGLGAQMPQAQLLGGGQERGLRAGTLNVPGIVALGVACDLTQRFLQAEGHLELQKLRDVFIHNVLSQASSSGGIVLNGHPTERLCHNIHFTIFNIPPTQLWKNLQRLAYTTGGSACTSGLFTEDSHPSPPASTQQNISHVMQAIQVHTDKEAATQPGTQHRLDIRFGLGRQTTAEQVQFASSLLIESLGHKT